MASTADPRAGLDTMMKEEHEAPRAIPTSIEEGKPGYKSFKKKFRKMKKKFDDAMRESNELYILEQKGIQKARQLAIENDQILDMLLDQNNSAQMPLNKRINLDAPSPALPPLHSINLTSEQIAAYADVPSPIRSSYHELVQIHNHHNAIKSRTTALPAPKSLADLLRTVPHKSLSHPEAPSDMALLLAPLDANTPAPGYLTPNEIDDTIETLDIKLGLEAPMSHPPPFLNEQGINPSFGNTNSPYNWLRKHVPHIFLQDTEDNDPSSTHPANPSINSKSKPGALRGAGKRAPIPAPSKPLAESLEIVEEDGQGYEFALGGPVSTKGKRKRDVGDEDPSGGYHPKTGRVEEQLKIGVKKPRQRKSTAKATAMQEDGSGLEGATATPPKVVKKRRPRVSKKQLPGMGVVNVSGEDM